jgi:hypothetical protein
MANYTPSANMLLPIPTIGVDPGPDWALNINSCLQQIDQHTHTANSGVPITPAAININADLAFNTYSGTGLKSLQMVSQATLSNLNAIYVKNNELYFNDGVGSAPIQITKAGAVNATSSGISNGTATASFVSSVLVVNSATNTPANIQGASLLMGNNLAGSNYLTLSPPNAMATNYNLTLPSVPLANSFLTIDTSGNITGSIASVGGLMSSNLSPSANITGSQLSASAGIVGTQIANATITGTQIAASTIDYTNLKPVNIAYNIPSSGAFTTSSTSFVNVTNLNITIITSGKPVQLVLQSDGSSNVSSSYNCNIRIITALNTIALFQGGLSQSGYGYSCIDFISAPGSITYQVQIQSLGGTSSLNYMRLVAYEIA